ncbi:MULTISPECIES: ABC transporter permease [Haloferax]|uniref:ABC transporter permease subunit n=4 Tax=Haloferax TaxID=2251 RepID=A0A6C0UTT5_HALVO|nr:MULTISPECIES: ABC transporter permease [Haloferax]MBC9986599.1 ABC transporter permease subunit [Haloferax sp. AS1]ELK55798.1 putative sulfate/tungstate ABC transporter permease [Haloferax sp. BAB-2207]ELZ75131.1 putative sulfate/tungstate ABC transporter permease [Haloferax lucentense DSM 14919]ELZ88406.1 putative sulfate/tungstate ABC transporter permease [Haloferax alexandrinus JCM 10717]NLV03442.1 ABC transporter permease subunit [Haloferax alexandrinus]
MFALGDLNLTYLVSITAVSLYVSTAAVALSAALGLPISLAVGFRDFYGKSVVTSVISTGMGFPSVVVGLVVLLVLSRSGPLGTFELLFTPEAMILSQTILALPVLVSVSLSAVQSVPQDLRDAAFAAGGTSTDVALLVVREARYGIVTALLAAYGRAISEVGSVLIVGGNIVFSDSTSFTRTLTTAITVEARKGNIETGIALGAILLALVLGVNALGARFRDRTPGRNGRGR